MPYKKIIALLLAVYSMQLGATYVGIRNLSSNTVHIKVFYDYLGAKYTGLLTDVALLPGNKHEITNLHDIYLIFLFESPTATVFEYGYKIGSAGRYLMEQWVSKDFQKKYSGQPRGRIDQLYSSFFRVPANWTLDFVIKDQGILSDEEQDFKA